MSGGSGYLSGAPPDVGVLFCQPASHHEVSEVPDQRRDSIEGEAKHLHAELGQGLAPTVGLWPKLVEAGDGLTAQLGLP